MGFVDSEMDGRQYEWVRCSMNWVKNIWNGLVVG